MKKVTVVIPAFNEAQNILPLFQRIRSVASSLKEWNVSILFVDDGSWDGTIDQIRNLQERGEPVGYILFSRNFGHQAALEAGILAAQADVIISLDADLQHPPEEIPRMLEYYKKGYEVVQMARAKPREGWKGFFSKYFYRFFALVAETEITPDASDFRLISKRVADTLRKIPERDKFLRALIPFLGFPQVVLSYEEAERRAGKPAYRFKTSLKMATRALLGYSHFPLTLVFWLGLTIAIVSFVTGLGHIIVRLLYAHKVVPGFTDIITSVLFLGGCTLATLGIIGRYLITILEQVRGRPAYVIAEQVLLPSPPETGAGSSQ